jgi:hypothetical protein
MKVKLPKHECQQHQHYFFILDIVNVYFFKYGLIFTKTTQPNKLFHVITYILLNHIFIC